MNKVISKALSLIYESEWVNRISDHNAALFLNKNILKNKRYAAIYRQLIKQGLKNSSIIPFQMKAIWPYWVYQQYLPGNSGFIPRDSNLPTLNTTCRTWTTLSYPGYNEKVTVDPHGLITPFQNGWSLDFWVARDEKIISPAHSKTVSQQLMSNSPLIQTTAELEQLHIISEAFFKPKSLNDQPCLFNKITLTNKASATMNFSFLLSIRPYNPEGSTGIHDITYLSANAFIINNQLGVIFNNKPDNIVCLSAEDGDVSQLFNKYQMILHTKCQQNRASACLEYRLTLAPGQQKSFSLQIPLKQKEYLLGPFQKFLNFYQKEKLTTQLTQAHSESYEESKYKFLKMWESEIAGISKFFIPDKQIEKLINQNLIYLQMFLERNKLFSGSLSYKEYSIREMVYTILAFNRFGLAKTSQKLLQKMLNPIPGLGFHYRFKNERDYAGQVLFMIMDCYRYHKNSKFLLDLLPVIKQMIRQISKSTHKNNQALKGLLKKGVAQEPTGGTDYYLADNFWALAGVKYAKIIFEKLQKPQLATKCSLLEINFKEAISRYLNLKFEKKAENEYLPVSISRDLDSGIIYNLVSIYPLNLYKSNDQIINNTLKKIEDSYFVNGAYFNEVGVNGYSPAQNCQLALTYLVKRDPRALNILNWLKSKASNTGCWPDLMHPNTNQGISGSGHSLSATAHYLLLIRNLICTDTAKKIHLFPMLPPEWLVAGQKIQIDQLPTRFGILNIKLLLKEKEATLEMDNNYDIEPPEFKVSFPKKIELFNIGGQDRIINGHTVLIPPKSKKISFHFSEDSSEA